MVEKEAPTPKPPAFITAERNNSRTPGARLQNHQTQKEDHFEPAKRDVKERTICPHPSYRNRR